MIVGLLSLEYHLVHSQRVKELRKADTFLRSDERMLGDSEFVQTVLEQAKEDENFHRKLQSSGITESEVRNEVSKIFHIEPEKIVSQTKDRTVVQARRLYCFWLIDEPGFSMTKVAKILDSSVSTISRSVKIGESISKEKGLQLTNGRLKN